MRSPHPAFGHLLPKEKEIFSLPNRREAITQSRELNYYRLKPIGFLAVSFGLKSFRSHARFLLSLDKFEPSKKKNLKVSPEGEGFRPIARTIMRGADYSQIRHFAI